MSGLFPQEGVQQRTAEHEEDVLDLSVMEETAGIVTLITLEGALQRPVDHTVDV